MSVEEELKEAAGEGHHPFDRKVAASMALIAAALAIVAVLGQFTSTEEVVLQQRASDQWSFAQGKSTRRYESDIAHEILAAIGNPAAQKASEMYSANASKLESDMEEIRKKATEFQDESRLRGLQSRRLHFGEVFLEIAIVLASLAILTHRHAVWATSLIAAAIGAAIAITTKFVHL